jgi:hypothetical protein
MGRAIRVAPVARVSRSRNGARARRLHAVREGSPVASGGDASLQATYCCLRSSAAAVTAGPLLTMPTVVPTPRLTDPWPSLLIGTVGSCAGVHRVAVLVPQSRRRSIGVSGGVASCTS